MAEKVETKVPGLLSKRWILAYTAFFGFFFNYALRVNMSVAIVCMVKDDVSNDTISSNSSTIDEDVRCVMAKADDSGNTGEFEWDKSEQSWVLSSFFYGYLVMQVPGGWLAGRFGAKRVLGIGILVTALATVMLPVAARWDYRAVYGLRAVMGVAESVSYPSMHAMWGRWAPSKESSKLTSLTYAGSQAGSVVTFIISGLLCSYGFDNGWGSIFYITGGAALVWVFAWFMIVSDTPESHPSITQAERDYILDNRGDKGTSKFSVPWSRVFRSRALLVCLVAHFCNNWMHYTLLTGLPTFMKEVLHYDIKQNGLLSSVPYMVMIVSQLCVGQIADFLRNHYLSTTYTRRLIQSISFLGSGACIVAAGFIDCENRINAVVLLAVAVGFEGLCYGGYMVNQIDIAPKYAGVLYGITNLISTIPGIVAPVVIGALTPNKTQEEWRNVFYVCGAFTMLGTIVFGGFASGEIEPWALDNDKGTEPEEKLSGANNLAFSVIDEPKKQDGVKL